MCEFATHPKTNLCWERLLATDSDKFIVAYSIKTSAVGSGFDF